MNRHLVHLDSSLGVKLICQPIPSDVVSVDVWVGAGAAIEQDHARGVAHLLEHMVFRGTEFDILIESQGGVSNAATSLDYTHFSFTVPSRGLGISLPYLANMLIQPRFTHEDLAQEKMVVLEEVDQCACDPDWCAYQVLQRSAYGDHPYGNSVLGSDADVQGLSWDSLWEFHQHFYAPANITIALAGAIDKDVVQTIIQENFVNASPVPQIDYPAPQARYHRQTVYLEHLQHSRLMIGWLGANAQSWQDGLKLDVVAMLLAGGRSALLCRSLREDLGWVYDIDCGFALQRQAGLFTITACLDSAYLEPVEHYILSATTALAKGDITPAELQRAKRSLLNSFIFAMESPSALASFLGYHTMLGCHQLCVDWANTYTKIVQSVQIEDIQRLASLYLSPEHSIVVSAVAG